MRDKKSNMEQSWKPCPHGKFGHLAKKLRHRQQRRLFLQTAASVGIVAVGGVGLWLGLSVSSRQERTYGSIACSDVRTHLRDYIRGSLDEDLRARITTHLKKCSFCRAKFVEMQQGRRPRKEAGGTA